MGSTLWLYSKVVTLSIKDWSHLLRESNTLIILALNFECAIPSQIAIASVIMSMVSIDKVIGCWVVAIDMGGLNVGIGEGYCAGVLLVEVIGFAALTVGSDSDSSTLSILSYPKVVLIYLSSTFWYPILIRD